MKKGMTRRERQVTERAEIIDILDRCSILHLGLSDDNMPYVVAMNYGYEMVGDDLILYLHGATTGYKLDVMKKNPNVFFEMDCDVEAFEGDLPCKYGTAYKSIMGRGLAEFVEDVEEKKAVMTIFMKTQSGKDFVFDDRLVSIVSVIRIKVSEYTAKRRETPEAIRAKALD